MASSIASQLQAIKSFVQADSEPLKRPFTRPSILFDPKEAADIDVDTVFGIALQGLEVLISMDERFRNYKNNLFSYKSREQDRELMGEEENKRINATISSYLRLISGHFQQPSSLKTLEYLIRRYKIHVHNVEDLVLCALPFHDTHAFVRLAQLLVLGNSKWKFLEGVKLSGAPPPRKVIVQQCVRDRGVLEVLCNYAIPSKNFHPARPVVNFCTAVVIEVLGTLTSIEPNVLNIVLLFIRTGLQPGTKGISDQKAGALMIVGLLANKAILVPKLAKSLIRSISEIANEDARESSDMQSVRLSLMALITLAQSQSVDVFPRKVLDILMGIRDLAGILLELSRAFNIDKFLSILMDSLVEYSFSSDLCQRGLISLIETIPMMHLMHNIITKVLVSCSKFSEKSNTPSSSNPGSWAKKFIIVVNKVYPSEFHSAVQKFFEDAKLQHKIGGSVYEIVCNTLDGSCDMSLPISDSKLLFALHHPKAEVRRAALSTLSTAGNLKAKTDHLESLVTVQDAILKLLRDDDLTVVQKAITLDGISDILSSSVLLKALKDVLFRCIGVLKSGLSANSNLAADIAFECLNSLKEYLYDHVDDLQMFFSLTFPLLLVLPKTKRLNLKALELAKEIKWHFYQNLAGVNTDMVSQRGNISSMNMDVVNNLAKSFLLHPEEYTPWLIESCKACDSSRVLFLLVVLQSTVMQKDSNTQFWSFFEVLFPVLKIEWDVYESTYGASIDKFKTEMLDWDCKRFLDQLVKEDHNELNAVALICIFWRLLDAYISSVNADMVLEKKEKWISMFSDLFVLFATSRFKHVFKEHLHYLVRSFKISPVHLLSRFFTDEGVPASVQVESLHCLSYLCSQSEEGLRVQLFAEFPSILVPLASDDKDTRIVAMNCIEGLLSLLDHANFSCKKNGSNAIWNHFLDKLLGLMVEQKRLILSDINFLPSFLASLLGSSSDTLIVPQRIDQRFDKATKEMILAFILGYALQLSDYGKLRILSLFKSMGNAILHVKEVEALLSLLLERRNRYHLELDRSIHNLSSIEVSILCLLLECCATPSSFDWHISEGYLLKALQLNGGSPSEDAIVRPSLAILQKLDDRIYSMMENEMQELLFSKLVLLSQDADNNVQTATREALMRLHITTSTISQMLSYVLKCEGFVGSLVDRKKKKKSLEYHASNSPYDMICKKENTFSFLSSVLDILLLKKDMANRQSLIGQLFMLLGKVFSKDWGNAALALDEQSNHAVSSVSQGISDAIGYIRQTILIVLEDICSSVATTTPQEIQWRKDIDIKLLIDCTHLSKDGVTRNHVYSLISSVAKSIPEKVVEHMLDILTLIGESAVRQVDSHSERVLEDLIAAVVPCWLSKTENMDKLLETFISILPEIAEDRMLKIFHYLLRIVGEWKGLASLLLHLFKSLVSKLPSSEDLHGLDGFMSFVHREQEYVFALHICEKYSCSTWLRALATMFKHMGLDDFCVESLKQLFLATNFCLDKLQGPEFAFRLASQENSDDIQSILGELLEQVVYQVQLVDTRSQEIGIPVAIRKEIRENMHAILRSITRVMSPSAFFRSTMNLLGHNNRNVGKKALSLLCETVKEHSGIKSKKRTKKEKISGSPWLHMDDSFLKLFDSISSRIVHLIDDSTNASDSSLKVAAVSAIEILASAFPSYHSTISVWLASIGKYITSNNLTLSSSCLRTCSTLINVLGPRSLSELPNIMGKVINVSRSCVVENTRGSSEISIQSSDLRDSVMLSVAITLEAVVEKLGGFLNPYLGDMLELLVLHPNLVWGADSKLKLKADFVRNLLTEKIPVRLVLPPLLKFFTRAVESGDSSLIITFNLLANIVGKMDRSSVTAYHTQIFDLCLCALDLRRQHPVSVTSIDTVENSVMSALSLLTLKLTESMFKPLFIRSVEWADSDLEDAAGAGSKSVDRAISFYGLVNKLAEKHRSLFVPYFKYLLDGCVRHLTNSGDAKYTGSIPKRKKAKVHVSGDSKEETVVISLKSWHIRALVLSSLHKCFLYDTGSLKFLDSSNFQVLLKPIVSQMASEPPEMLDENINVPSVNKVDDVLVNCIGQMAVATGSDSLWKHLNHEVLMQTRSDKVRTRILGLRIVKYLVENLKEEYLVLLPETIPFLGELLEDVELSVKSLAQDILKEMESMSGESLRQYL
ncbi:uncharacterized protein At3g06530 [Cucurbita moschata]|uniref:Uncharacterized protein At3g06530 n=1 Tax=Cucurbita moschata TaxID=3662 RepID=A0A6J1FWC5_CUCMO|nr:uncharacterized protein At3g06530 [Cucurbita moschata]